MKNIKYIFGFYFLLFLYFYFFTLNFNYVEGDDASTILYHLCGRNSQIQQPYATYNSGLDFLIEISSLHSEASMRTFAVLLSFVSGFIILLLLAVFLDIFFDDVEKVDAKNKFYFYFLLPFIVPDLIFHSLIINSAYISFVFLLSSLIIFIKFLKTNRNLFLYLSTLLFGLSIPFRWTMLIALPLYMGFALYYNPIEYYSKKVWLLFLKICVANVVGVMLAFGFIYITGYNLEDIYNTIIFSVGYIESNEKSTLALLATASAFLTPSLIFLVLFGFITIYKKSKSRPKYCLSMLGLIVLSILPCFVVGFFPSYKFLITLFPMLLILMCIGFDSILNKKLPLIGFLLLVIFPWFVGIQLDVKGTFCGPGFELNTKKEESSLLPNPNQSIKIDRVNLKLDSGFYLPMLEGPRPLYGYFYVLFGNGWKNQITLFTKERQKTLEILINDKNVVYIQSRKTAYFQCDLYQKGFSTQTGFTEGKNIQYRNFKNKNSSITVNVVPDNCSKNEWIEHYFKTDKNVIIYSSSQSNEILKLQKNKENKIELIGPFTVIKK
ncbi:hypothetical protein [Flavobacterium sp.]|uniref:hypothetical protein n=1 Tax=Flavobacterium sp. TaxID=239 RepID=UPI00286DB997|nr:hypothetical protein [Flavobacterium sp.]